MLRENLRKRCWFWSVNSTNNRHPQHFFYIVDHMPCTCFYFLKTARNGSKVTGYIRNGMLIGKVEHGNGLHYQLEPADYHWSGPALSEDFHSVIYEATNSEKLELGNGHTLNDSSPEWCSGGSSEFLDNDAWLPTKSEAQVFTIYTTDDSYKLAQCCVCVFV